MNHSRDHTFSRKPFGYYTTTFVVAVRVFLAIVGTNWSACDLHSAYCGLLHDKKCCGCLSRRTSPPRENVADTTPSCQGRSTPMRGDDDDDDASIAATTNWKAEKEQQQQQRHTFLESCPTGATIHAFCWEEESRPFCCKPSVVSIDRVGTTTTTTTTPRHATIQRRRQQ